MSTTATSVLVPEILNEYGALTRVKLREYLPTCDANATRVNVSYNLNRLQNLDTAVSYIVTLNGEDAIDPEQVVGVTLRDAKMIQIALLRIGPQICWY